MRGGDYEERDAGRELCGKGLGEGTVRKGIRGRDFEEMKSLR